MTVFGVAHFFRRDLRQDPQIAVEIVRLLQSVDEPLKFQGMLSGSDEFSPLRSVSDKTLRELRVDVMGQVYSTLLIFRGDRDKPTSQLSLDLFVASQKEEQFVQTAEYVSLADGDQQLIEGQRVSAELWDFLAPAYGFSVFGSSYNCVLQELSGVPISDWKSQIDPAIQERLLRFQSTRQDMGRSIRGAAWGTYLSSKLVQELGGPGLVRRKAPVFAVEPLSGGGLYLRLSEQPVLLDTSEYDRAALNLEDYLSPIVAKKHEN